MKSFLLLLSFLLAATLLWMGREYFAGHPSPPEAPPLAASGRQQSESNHDSSRHSSHDESAELIGGTSDISQLIADSRKKTNVNLSKLAKGYTPLLKEAMVTTNMKKLKTEIQPFLESWKLDVRSTDEVFRVFRDLQVQWMEIEAKQLALGIEGVSARQEEERTALAATKTQLAYVIGDERAEQLLQVRQDYYTKKIKTGLEKSLK